MDLAETLPGSAWNPLVRRPKYEVRTQERARPENVKERIVKERGFENIRLCSEQVAEFEYRPVKCRRTYRVVALRKNLSVEKGQTRLFDDCRYFFYITNSPHKRAAGDRAGGERPVQPGEPDRATESAGRGRWRCPWGTRVSNWAYLVMASLAWTLKAWLALGLPEDGRWQERRRAEKQTVLRMEFKKFVNALVRVPCQIVRTGRRIVYRLLAWNPWLGVLVRGVGALRVPPGLGRRPPMRC